MNLPAIAPYFEGYLAAARYGTREVERGLMRLPPNPHPGGSDAEDAFFEGLADYVRDTAPRKPFHRVSRAYPPWRRI